MIPFNFMYIKASSIKEAISEYKKYSSLQVDVMYYAGGTEIITMCRTRSIKPNVIIDLKDIPALTSIKKDDWGLHIGAACSLKMIQDSNMFDLLALVSKRIADHTNQCRITLGGNLCGSIIYREMLLPLLLSYAEITLFGLKGKKRVALNDIVEEGRIQKSKDEIVETIHVPLWALNAPYFHIKHTANEKIDYPLINTTALFKDKYLCISFSGLCSFPFRSKEIEKNLNDSALTINEKIEKTITLLPEVAQDNFSGTGTYRLFVLKNTLNDLLKKV